ncbi:MAG: hypothetical protein L0Z68_07890 [Gammaproteobacteria bacterium]|nr:hypothetical protein [Gammaproteobacteria bacterium]
MASANPLCLLRPCSAETRIQDGKLYVLRCIETRTGVFRANGPYCSATLKPQGTAAEEGIISRSATAFGIDHLNFRELPPATRLKSVRSDRSPLLEVKDG